MDEGMNLKDKGNWGNMEDEQEGGVGSFVTCWTFAFRASASRETRAVREDSGLSVNCCTLLVAGSRFQIKKIRISGWLENFFKMMGFGVINKFDL